MSIRVSLTLTVSLVALAGAGCTTEVTQQASAPFNRAAFDPAVPSIPTPNDLLLKAAPGVTDPTTRGALFALINAGGFLADYTTPGLGALSVISIPYERVVAGAGTTPTVALDAATIDGSTVAIVRVSGAGAPEVIAPAVIQNVPGAIRLLPATGYTPGTRYVVALRGGPDGVRTADGEELVASSVMFVVTDLNVELDNPDGRPAIVDDEQAAGLETLRAVLGAPLEWDKEPSVDICAAALGIPAAAIPEGMCWLYAVSTGVLPAFTAVDLVFPVTEAVSIQAFEIAPAP